MAASNPSHATRNLARLRLGIDLGGTKIEIVALDRDGGERFRRRVPTPQGDYEATLAAIAAPGRRRRAARSARTGVRVGIGTPGSLSRATGLLARRELGLPQRPADSSADLEALLGRDGPDHATTPTASRCRRRTDGAGRGRARRVRRRSSAPAWARASWSTGSVLDGPQRALPASGATIRCRGRATTSVPGSRASAGGAAASRRSLSGPGSRARPSRARPARVADRARSSRDARARRRRVRRDARALRGAPRARARARDQHPRSRRDRAGRRDVEHRSAVRARAAAVGRVGILRSRRHAARAGTCTATRAACAARRGCGRSMGAG